jgi:hypothetical protein
MATLLLEGFDKYGTANQALPNVNSLLAQGGWNFFSNYFSNPLIVSGLSGAGEALTLQAYYLQYSNLVKALTTNYSRLIGGFRFQANLVSSCAIEFLDNATIQCYVLINRISGFIALYQGNGTLLIQTTVAVGANSVHFLEFDITFNTNISLGGATIWLDGVQVFSLTAVTSQSGNSYASVIQFTAQPDAVAYAFGSFTIDDLYLFDNTTSYNNSVLLSNPRIFTQVATGDHQTQFTNLGNVIGNSWSQGAGGIPYTTTANSLYLIPFTPNVNCTVNSIALYGASTGATQNFKGVIYANSSGSPGSLLSSGTQVTGYTSGSQLTLPLTTPQNLTAATQYWLGFITDSVVVVQNFDYNPQTTSGYTASNTYSSGAPASAPAMTPNQTTLALWGICTGASTNWESISLNPPIGDSSAVYANATSKEDLYIFPALPSNVVAVYSVGISGNAKLTFPGTHTFDLVISSSGTIGTGSKVNIAPTLNYYWYDSYFDTNPATSGSWGLSSVTACYVGMEIIS